MQQGSKWRIPMVAARGSTRADNASPFMITTGRLADLEQLEGIVIKATGDGRMIRVRDLARVELGAEYSGFASLDGKPTVVLAIYPTGQAPLQDTIAAVRARLVDLRRRFPEGVDADAGFGFMA